MIIRVVLVFLCYVVCCQATDVCGGYGYEMKICKNGCCNHKCCPEEDTTKYYDLGYKIGKILGAVVVGGIVIAGIVTVVCIYRKRRKNQMVVYTQLTNPSSAVTISETSSNTMMATPQV